MSISWLLFKKSVVQSWRRLALTSAAVGIGILVLLVFISGVNALSNRSARTEWQAQIYNAINTPQRKADNVQPLIASTLPTTPTDGNMLKWQDDYIWTVHLYAEDENTFEIPGISTPKPGEYLLSPGMKKIIKDNPDVELASRFGDKDIGQIPKQYLDSPDTLLAVIGMTEQQAKTGLESNNAAKIYNLDSGAGNFMYTGVMAAVFSLGAVILLFPVVIFLIVATKLGSTQREQRYAAMRLIGATKSQITRIIALESFMAALAGIIIGWLIFLSIRSLIADFRLDGARFWVEDFVIPFWQYSLAIGITLGLSLAANWWGMRHVRISPLGVSRRQTVDKKPRFWSVLPLLIGLGVILYARFTAEQDSASEIAVLAVVGGVVLTMFGLILAGPYLTERTARLVARFTSSAETLLSSKRIAMQSRGIFRSVSGVVIALFAGSFYLTAVSGIDNYENSSIADNGYSRLNEDTVLVSGKIDNNFTRTLQSQSYVSSVTEAENLMGAYTAAQCSAIKSYTKLDCEGKPDSYYRAIKFPSGDIESTHIYGKNLAEVKNKLQKIETDGVMDVDSDYLLTLTDSKQLENLRTLILKTKQPEARVYVTSGEFAQRPKLSPLIKELSGLTYLGMIVVLFIAIISLIVATIGGILERKRSLMTLRLGGMTLGQMKRVVFIESLIPLLSASLFATGLGIAVGYLFMQMVSASLDAVVSVQLLGTLAASIALAALGIYLVLPVLKSAINIEANRTE